MAILNFKPANCKNCYKCLRHCPVKAISFLGENAQVIDDKCILCGHCIQVCPQNAKKVEECVGRVKAAIAEGRKVVATVAPSAISSFCETSREQLYNAILSLGFYAVSDTAEGAKLVTAEYAKMIDSGKYKNFITSACPAVVTLIQYSYHNALPYLAPVDSPMVAHAKILKQRYGEDAFVVFIGPCIAKKREGQQSDAVDAVISFEELLDWFHLEAVDLKAQPKQIIPEFRDRAWFYPVPRGIIKSFWNYDEKYDYIYVDGVEKCKEVLNNIENLNGVVLELSACENSCINGPCSIKNKGSFIKANETVRNFAKANSLNPTVLKESPKLKKNIKAIRENIKMPSEAEISAILKKLGKNSENDLLNCGACGYETCRQKAVAVFNGLATLDMCLPYMRERAETISSEIIMSSPNGVISVDSNLCIVEINEQAREIFGITDRQAKGKALVDYINPIDFMLALNNIETVVNKKVKLEKTEKWVELSIFNVKKHNLLFCMAKDITNDVKYQELMKKVQLDTANTTSKVIEKQMSIVQEIASLLGETTAETKIALTKLKNTITDDFK